MMLLGWSTDYDQRGTKMKLDGYKVIIDDECEKNGEVRIPSKRLAIFLSQPYVCGCSWEWEDGDEKLEQLANERYI